MNKQELLTKFYDLQKKLYAYAHAQTLVNWDGATFAPEKSVEGRAITTSILGGESHALTTSEDTVKLVEELQKIDDLELKDKRNVEVFAREVKKMTCLPMEEVMEYMKLRAEAEQVWVKAKTDNDFKLFAPYLEKLIEFQKKYAKYINPDAKPYNTLLDDYQEGLTMDTLDKYFAEIEKTVVPLNAMVAKSDILPKVKAIKERIDAKGFDKEGQEKLVDKLFELQGLPKDRCKIAVSEHPFTSGANCNDIRYTVAYHEDNLASAIYAALHEGGHAMYELNTNHDYIFTPIATGASMTMHESQSRIYENNISRSEAFNKHIYKLAKEVFPTQFEDISEEDFYLYCNYSSPSFIRIEADELTYSLHVMIRYQVERMIFEDGVDVMDLPQIWNKKYEEYLGICPPNDTQGVLQDVHWSFGLFGYFPTYSLGTAYSAQFEATMKEAIDYDGALEKGDLTEITNWLRENIHTYGKLLIDDEIVRKATGKEFDPSYYAKYLEKKYTEIYG